jgi:type II secretory ATPase GspE/PulE/Tfp pilus assembly ATPase PilB-like protein
MDIAVRRRPQDGGFVLDGPRGVLSLRVSTIPAGNGEKAVIRLLDPKRVPGGLDALGLAPDQESRIRRVISSGRGVLLATGPTGSGKSSTLQAALQAVDRERLNVVALEDPVEYRVPGVVHVQMATRAGLTFATALRAVLRQDPDVVMVGEIRDRETAEIAMSAAVTGHLVLSSLHTTDAPGAVARLIHMGVPPHLVAAGLTGVVAQRLVRVVCRPCRGRGCGACRDGYLGRTGVFQVLVMDDRLREAVATGASTTTLRRLAREGGMGTLADDARRAVAEGTTLPHEAARVTRGDPGAAPPCSGCGGLIPVEARACPWCGRHRGRWCTCGIRLRPGWRFCPDCARRA